jgi:hypothetical protein
MSSLRRGRKKETKDDCACGWLAAAAGGSRRLPGLVPELNGLIGVVRHPQIDTERSMGVKSTVFGAPRWCHFGIQQIPCPES